MQVIEDQGDSEPRVAVNIYLKTQQVFSTEFSSTLQLGRQRPGEPGPFTRVGDRVIVAELRESDVSREHISLTLVADGQVRVTNSSSINPILMGTDIRIQPGEQRDVKLPTLLTLFDRVIQLERQAEKDEPSILDSFAHRTRPPGSNSSESRLVDILAVRRSDKETEMLLRGMHATIVSFQQATNSAEFYSQAAQAMIDIVGMEDAAALIWNGSRWQVAARTARQTIESEATPWRPSRKILRRVREEQRTLWQVPDMEKSPSTDDLKALVATPILNRNAEVIGALYGDRRRSSIGTANVEISEVEAILVELLATSLSEGLSRLEQEQHAIKARVLFEQFFSPELSRQLEAHPDLLHGKDSEVTLLFCDIRGLSEVSERLGPRLTLDWINDVMGTLSGCVAEHHGVFVDSVGDELTGMWGAPVERPDHASLACAAAIHMLDQLPALNRRWQSVLEQPMNLGIGIHTGAARVGNIGSDKKFQYGPLGKTVGLARRTQRATAPLQTNIVVSSATASKLDSSFPARRLCRVTPDDHDPIDLYELAAQIPDDWPDLQRRYETALESFEQGDYPTATKLLAKVLTDHPNDRPTLQLLSRINGKLSPMNWTF